MISHIFCVLDSPFKDGLPGPWVIPQICLIIVIQIVRLNSLNSLLKSIEEILNSLFANVTCEQVVIGNAGTYSTVQ